MDRGNKIVMKEVRLSKTMRCILLRCLKEQKTRMLKQSSITPLSMTISLTKDDGFQSTGATNLSQHYRQSPILVHDTI